MTQAQSLLIVGAHPDDETFFAGTMAKYVDEGAKVGIVCATRGERGATADLCSIPELPQVRESELREAMSILGVTDVHFLPYEDQKLWQAPADEIRRQLTAIIRAFRPTIILTFDPNGANQHTDHITIARFTYDAVSAAADSRWYPETGSPHTISRVLWQPPLPTFKIADIPDLSTRPGVDFLIDTRPYWQKKAAAIRAYRTQLPGLKNLFFYKDDVEQTLSVEAFRVGWGPRPAEVPCPDLFHF